ncbi:hypothetical protein HUX88_03220 [Duganella sp. BJB1802]|uniref:LCCL domain-containing protein n=1 Tax=Duganella sp. BJB1802 TaxID=2744575 RepID=UPI001593C5B1|nr:LCCL domain-containing protein [Duganella sp. BJB1802]NVD69567.1 hypothetical protein [Duganella sp. BJB1802]
MHIFQKIWYFGRNVIARFIRLAAVVQSHSPFDQRQYFKSLVRASLFLLFGTVQTLALSATCSMTPLTGLYTARVTAGASVVGNNVNGYTSNSNIPMALVHSGLLAPEETAYVTITPLGQLPQFVGTPQINFNFGSGDSDVPACGIRLSLTKGAPAITVPAPTVSVQTTPSPARAGQPYTTTWSTTNATSLQRTCLVSASVDVNGSITAVAPTYGSLVSSCTWVASGPGGQTRLETTLLNSGLDGLCWAHTPPSGVYTATLSKGMKVIGSNWSGYRADSSIPAALIHSGLLAEGQSADVTVSYLGMQGPFQSSWGGGFNSLESSDAACAMRLALTASTPPTIKLTVTPSPLVANQSYQMTWSSDGATSVRGECSDGMMPMTNFPANGSISGIASPAWAAKSPTYCNWNALGPGGFQDTHAVVATTLPTMSTQCQSATPVTGTYTGNASGGAVWGNNTDGYRTDSNVGAAAVHAGLLADGMIGQVIVTPVDILHSFKGTASSGVTAASSPSAGCGMRLSVPPAPVTLSVQTSPLPLVAGRNFTSTWSTSGASEVRRSCTARAPGYAGNVTLPGTGVLTEVASWDWTDFASTCTWTATGPGGTQTYTETRATVPPPISAFCLAHTPASGDYVASDDGSSIWGDNVNGYDYASRVDLALVHSGLLHPGESSFVRITPMDIVPSFPGSTAHGVTSGTVPAPECGMRLWVPGGPAPGQDGPPTASLSTPENGRTFIVDGTSAAVVVSGTGASMPGNVVLSIELLDGNAVIASAKASTNLNTTVPLALGNHQLKLRVTDSANRTTSSSVTTVTVASATQGNSAAFMSQNVPLAMQAGEPTSVTIRMVNSGTTTWTPGGVNPFRLGAQSPQDNQLFRSSGRVNLLTQVAPGEVGVFTFTVTPPAVAGTYRFQWKMLQESVGWFGDSSPAIDVVVANNPGPVATLTVSPPSARVYASAKATLNIAAVGTSFAMNTSKLEVFQDNFDGNDFQATPINVVAGNSSSASSNFTVSVGAGTYWYKARVTDEQGHVRESARVSVNVTNSPILGKITGINIDAANTPHLVGWVCESGVNQALKYQVLLDAPSLAAGATSLATGVANVATEADNLAVQTACATPGFSHHFNIDLTPYTGQYPGRALYVQAMGSNGGSDIVLPCADGSCTMPGSLRIALSTPPDGQHFAGAGPVFIRTQLSGGAGPYDEVAIGVDGVWTTANADGAADAFSISKTLAVRAAPYAIQARVRKGNITLHSVTSNIFVDAAAALSITLSKPVEGSAVANGGQLVLEAKTAGSDSSIASVKFFANSQLVATATKNGSIWSAVWSNVQTGVYGIKAAAFDGNGVQLAQSAVVSVTVRGAGGGADPDMPLAVEVDIPHLTDADAGTLPGELSVTPLGTAAYSIPIAVPPGTAGLQPELTLNYGSDAGNGLLGLGWQLGGLSSIHRCGKTIAQDGINDRISFSSSDRLCLDGQRLVLVNLPLTDDNYWADGAEYRTEIDSFSRITAVGTTTSDNIANRSFKIESRDGRVLTFGSTRDSAVAALIIGSVNSGVTASQPSAKNGAQSWALDAIKDRAGNYISISYLQDADSGEHRPDAIRYGGVGFPAHAGLQFVYEPRTDAWKRYIDESRNDLRHRMTHIRTYVGIGREGDVLSAGVIVRDYALDYEQSPTSGRSLLTAVQVKARNPQTGELEPMPKTKFAWGQPDPKKQAGFESKGFWDGAPILTVWANTGIVQYPVNGANRSEYFSFSDFENHGRSDVLEKRVARPRSSSRDDFSPIQPGALRAQYRYFHNNGSGFTQYNYKLDTGESFVVLETADFDGDGAPDLLVSTESNGPKICLSPLGKPSGLGSPETPLVFTCDPTRGAVGDNVSSLSPYVTDVMGDGRAAVYSQMDEDGKAQVCIQFSCLPDDHPPMNVLFGKPGVEPYTYVNTARFISTGDNVDFGGIGKPYDVRWTAPSYISFSDSEGQAHGGRWVNLQPRILMTGFHHPSDTRTVGTIAPYAYETATSLSGGGLTPYVFDAAAQGGSLSGDLNGSGYSSLAFGFYNYDSASPTTIYKRAEMTLCLSTGRALDCAIRQKYSKGHYLGIRAVSDFVGDGQPKMLAQNVPFLTSDGSTEGGLNMCRVTGDDSTGGARADDSNIQCDPWSGLNFSFTSNTAGMALDQVYLMDLLGTGRTQLVYYHSGKEVNSAWIEDGRWEVFAPIDVAVTGQALDRIYQVTNGLGAVSSVEYADGLVEGVVTRSPDVKFAYPLRANNGVGKVVKRLRKANGGMADLTVSYQYKDGATDQAGRGTLGYAQVIAVEERPGSTDVLKTTTTSYRLDWPYTGTVLSSSVTAQDGKTLVSSINSPDLVTVSQANGAVTVCPVVKQNVTVRKDLDGSALGTSTTVNQYGDGWCNLTKQDVSVVDDSVKGGGTTFAAQTVTTFRNDAANWLIGLPLVTTVTRTDPQSNPTSVTRVTSNEYEPTRGLLITQTVQPGDPVYQVVTSYDRSVKGNPFGLVNSQSRKWRDPATASDMNPVDRSTVYDERGRYPKTVTNALLQSEQYAYDAATGIRTMRTDRNGLQTTWTLNGYGRVLVEKSPDQNETRYFSKSCSPDCPAGAVAVAIVERYHGSDRIAVPRLNYMDNVGRMVRDVTWGFDGTKIVADTRYDDYGRQYEVDHPHFDGNSALLASRHLYDDLHRVVKVETFDVKHIPLTAMTTYQGLTRIQKNDKGQTRIDTSDVLGQVRQVEQVMTEPGTESTLTKFGYDPFGNLNRTIDPNKNVIAVKYDVLGHKVELADPDLGTIKYSVDPVGQVWKQVTPNQSKLGQATTFNHDVLGRMTARYETDLESHWVFDQQEKTDCVTAKSCGQLIEAYTLAGARKDYDRLHTYDDVGRLKKTVQTIGDGAADSTYSALTSFDAWGRVIHQTYQRDTDVSKVFDSRYNKYGYLARLERAGVPLWQVVAQDAWQRPTEVLLGNGLTHKKIFDGDTGRLQDSTLAAGDKAAVLSESYLYDVLGNVTTRAQLWNQGGYTEGFGYDELNRLTSSQTGSALQTFAYDGAGNLKRKTGVGSIANGSPYVYLPQGADAVRPHAVWKIDGDTFQYDDNGNLLSGGGRSYTWNSFDMPITIKRGAETSSFVYGPEHQRTRQRHGDGSTEVYAGAQELERNGSQLTIRTYWPYGIGLEIDRSGAETALYWSHVDRLGSPMALSDQSGVIQDKLAYDAWGKRRTTDGASSGPFIDNKGFTGHEMLDQVELVHMNGRVYDPYLAKFLSADPRVTDPSNGQSFNRYSYVQNNPTNLTDPTGFDAVVEITGARCWICHDPDFIRSTWVSLKAKGSEFAKNSGKVIARVPLPVRRAVARAVKREVAGAASLAVPVTTPFVEVAGAVWGAYEIGSAIYNAANDQGKNASDAVSSDAGKQADTNSVPPVPGDYVGDQGDKRAGTSESGKRHTSGPLTPENGGTGDAEKDFDKLTGGTGKPFPDSDGRSTKPGYVIGDNGIWMRPGSKNPGDGPRIEIPGNGNKLPETLHY